MNDALLGCTGFVGSTLLRQTRFDAQFRSTNIGEVAGRQFDTVICAAAPAKKWIANRDPQADRQQIDGLIGHLRTLSCRRLVLISTVDVFADPLGVDESSPVDESALQAYGAHRRLLERFVEEQVEDHLVIRLPGLVGPGLRKNIIFDLRNDNNVHQIDSRGQFQFYPMVNLWHDLELARAAGLRLVHLTAEPVTVSDVAAQGFGRRCEQVLPGAAARYDFRTRHASVFGGQGAYQYSARETMLAVRAYAQSEPRTAPLQP